MDVARLLAWRSAKGEAAYGGRDAALYALGLGIGGDPLDAAQLAFVVGERAAALPTMATILAFDDAWIADAGVDRSRVLHGEQHLRLLSPLPPAGRLAVTGRIGAVYDKGAARGAVVVHESQLADGAGRVVASLAAIVLCRGDGGFGGTSGAPERLAPVPRREPDAHHDHPTLPQQALLYALSGDANPLHWDPAAAQRVGFPRPILHGLCTYGIAGYALVRLACGGDPARLRAIAARFTAPVFSGETIRTEIWREPGRTAFRARVLERNVVVLDGGVAETG